MGADSCGKNTPAVMNGKGLWKANLLVFETLPSTNQWAIAHVADLQHGNVIHAISQTAGRGRFQRAWRSPGDRGLTLSVILDATITSGEEGVSIVNQAAALAVAALLDEYGIHAKVKWPNDVLVGGKKIAGILTELDTDTGRLVLGVGLNVHLASADVADKEWAHPATSMAIEKSEETFNTATVRARLLRRLEQHLDLIRGVRRSELSELWRARDYLAGKRIHVHTTHEKISGLYAGVHADGRLRLIDDTGKERRFWSGDVTLRHSETSRFS